MLDFLGQLFLQRLGELDEKSFEAFTIASPADATGALAVERP
jgi:hypothetical protein